MKLAIIFAKAEGNVSLTYEVISKFCTLPEVPVQVENYRVDGNSNTLKEFRSLQNFAFRF